MRHVMTPNHAPVLLAETMELCRPSPGEAVLDCTLGLGGHAAEFLARTGPSGTLVGIDADEANLRTARDALRLYGERARFIHANFRELPACLPDKSATFDVIFADLGLSSPHLDDPGRGFSFRADAPLDMRFDRSTGATAADLLATLPERELVMIFQKYGELPRAHALTKTVVSLRTREPVVSTAQLFGVVTSVYGYRAEARAPQVFQALRIAVNDELGSLDHLLKSAPAMLKPGGRLGIISFHSLEDRMVKHTFRDLIAVERDPVTGADVSSPSFELITKRAVAPSEQEVKRNPRARSAKLRILRRFPVLH